MSSSSSSSPLQSDNAKEPKTQKTIPVVLLAGFLGSGKTTAIQHLLDQTQTESNCDDNNNKLKIGVIVNDVASVNIDAKLLKQSTSFVDASGDDGNNVIVPSTNSNSNTSSNSNIWIELQNGCVCCSIQDEWWTAVESLLRNQKRDDAPSLDAIVVELSGVADPLALLQSTQQKALASNSGGNSNIDLTFRIVTVVDACTFGTDFYTWDLVADRPAWQMRPLADEYYSDNEELHSSPDARRKVAELLAEQVEAAHGILLNKMDVVTPTQRSTAHAMVQALNDQADVQMAVQGRVDPHWILFGTDKDSVEARNKNRDNTVVIEGDDTLLTTTVDAHASHSHSHDHDHRCSNPTTCTDPTHNHETTQSAISTTEPSSSLTVQNLGITSFVYKANRPFDMMRLRSVLNQWPVPVSDTLEILGDAYSEPSTTSTSSSTVTESTNSLTVNPFTGILRSKGFCWTAPQVWSLTGDAWRHDTAMYWSHAGRQMGISTAGKWWASIPDAKMQSYFVDNRREYDRIQREDFVSVEFGDRRQEIVFIETSLQVEAITAALDECLYTDREMETYRQKLRNFMDSRYTAVTASPSHGLFGVGPVDHTDL